MSDASKRSTISAGCPNLFFGIKALHADIDVAHIITFTIGGLLCPAQLCPAFFVNALFPTKTDQFTVF